MTRARIESLAAATEDSIRAQVCVIGAGAAGCYVARRLAEHGVDVVLIEAGGNGQSSPEEAGFEVDCPREAYPGATEGRSFGVGGSTSRWGGLLVPHSRHDLRPGSASEAKTWEAIVDRAERHGKSVLETLGFKRTPDFETFFDRVSAKGAASLEKSGISVLSSLYLPFRRKNLRFLIERENSSARAPRLFLNAVVRAWSIDEAGRVRSVEACGADGVRRSIHADRFVLCAGAIESARTLLELVRDLPADRTLSKEIGIGLGDHLSVAIADVSPAARASAIGEFSPRFHGEWMRSFRFVETDAPEGEPRAFAHFVFDNESPGFKLAKDVLTALQARRLPAVGFREIATGLVGGVRLGLGRFMGSRLYIPKDTPTRLQIDMEQPRSNSNRIVLGATRDRFDRPIPEIHWSISDADAERLRSTSAQLLDRWESLGARLPAIERRDLSFDSEKPHDAYHPVGVCRMGPDPDAVVDLRLRVNGVENVWVVSTAVLPTAGTANPTFTMLCLAEEILSDLGCR